MEGRFRETGLSIARAGRAAPLGLLLAAALVVVGLLVVAWLSGDTGAESGRGVEPDLHAAPPSASDRSPAQAPEAGGDASTMEGEIEIGAERASEDAPAPVLPLAEAQSRSSSPADGVIRGRVEPQPGSTMPDSWRLVVGPSVVLTTAEPAARRAIDYTGGERAFEVRDLPLAGYAVRVEAAGWNSLPVHVLLSKTSKEQIVSLVLTPSGFLDGSVVEKGGRAIGGVMVTLESEATRERRTVESQADGTFLFRDVQDGPYRIFVGEPDSPLVPAKSLVFAAPSLRFPDIEIPQTGGISIRTVDVDGKALSHVELTGFGSNGGRFALVSDERGQASARFLPPGSYRIFASAPDRREHRSRIDVGAGKTAQVEIVLQGP